MAFLHTYRRMIKISWTQKVTNEAVGETASDPVSRTHPERIEIQNSMGYYGGKIGRKKINSPLAKFLDKGFVTMAQLLIYRTVPVRCTKGKYCKAPWWRRRLRKKKNWWCCRGEFRIKKRLSKVYLLHKLEPKC